MFWRSPTYLDCTLRRRRRWTVCYSAQVTAISIYFCTLPCTSTFALFLQREMHTQITIIFAHFFWTAQTHSHARTHEHKRFALVFRIFPSLAPIFAPFGCYFGSSFDSWLWRLISLHNQIGNRAHFTLTSHTHARTQKVKFPFIFFSCKIANSRTFLLFCFLFFTTPNQSRRCYPQDYPPFKSRNVRFNQNKHWPRTRSEQKQSQPSSEVKIHPSFVSSALWNPSHGCLCALTVLVVFVVVVVVTIIITHCCP